MSKVPLYRIAAIASTGRDTKLVLAPRLFVNFSFRNQPKLSSTFRFRINLSCGDGLLLLVCYCRVSTQSQSPYRGTSLIRSRLPLGPYSRTMPRALWGP